MTRAGQHQRCSSAFYSRKASYALARLGAMFVWPVIGTLAAQAQTYSEVVLHSFAPPPRGAFPIAGVIRDSAGNLYGTTSGGGSSIAGVVYKVGKAGQQTILHSFTGGADGGNPYAGVILDSTGNLYGTTHSGGTTNAGVVYKLDATGTETVLYSFTGGADGGGPSAGVTLDSAGNLYGTTPTGGTANAGVVYKLDTTGMKTVLHSFTGGADGVSPIAGVIRDSAGNLYGATAAGGAANAGVVYKLDTTGHETVLYSFTGGADGANPYASLIEDSAGNLYGTTYFGGTLGYGVVFKLPTTGMETVLYSFAGGADGGHPNGGVVRDSSGDLYGTTFFGGTAEGYSGYGVAYKLNTAGHETVLHSFTGGADGGLPEAGVIRDSSGNLYGTTNSGGAADLGSVYKLDTAGNETVIYSFPGSAGGSNPYATVIRDSAGNLYGTTYEGGLANAGVVYKLSAAGHETVLYSFTGGADGGHPYAGVVRDSAGNLYGTASAGGTAGAGVVYKLDTSANYTVLYNFTGGIDGGTPYAGVILDSVGNLYGTTLSGGATGGGVVYQLSSAGQQTVLHSFALACCDVGPYAGVIRDSAGNLYGTTTAGGIDLVGVLYKLDISGNYSALYNFIGGTDGSLPYAGVILDSSGNLYGTTLYGGGNTNDGVVYTVNAAGQETILCRFNGGAYGGHPYSGVIRDPAGNLYGTTYQGGVGTLGWGVVYKLSTTGEQTLLYTFTGGADGGNPYAGLIEDSAGNLYGTTSAGGSGASGVVFKLKR